MAIKSFIRLAPGHLIENSIVINYNHYHVYSIGQA
jgi:hypothetical protein